MDVRYQGRLPEWRYRKISGPSGVRGNRVRDDFRREAESQLAAAGLPWCFGEMGHPHWRMVPVSGNDTRSVSYYAGDDVRARQAALDRIILCSKCPVFDRCGKVSMAKKTPDPRITPARLKIDMLAALNRK